MKKLILPFTIALFSYLGMHAQAPKSFNYQGIARNSTGTPIPSQNISLKISIKEGSENGSVVYSEVQSTSTNAYGLYNISIGKGTVEQGNMEDIDWGDGNKYIQVQIDPEGGNDYVNLGTTQLLSVPYALYA
ncbi:MAG TPA: hypothetical protein VK027_04310, partial [Chitinophagaceae bacterium]|nr:hypothetical protein [Chitinophagaceae bacterium]